MSNPEFTPAPAREPVSPESARRFISIIDALIDDPARLGIDPAVFSTVNPNTEVKPPYTDASRGETYEGRFLTDKDTRLEVQRTYRWDDELLIPRLVATRSFALDLSGTERCGGLFVDDKPHFVDFRDTTNGYHLDSNTKAAADNAEIAFQFLLEDLANKK